MNYIVLDLEWNQSSTGKEEVCKELPFEIIEIGAIKLNSERKMISEFNELVKPQVYHQMHQITRKLIHLQMEQLQKGDLFPEVMTKFRNWYGDDIIFCTWGPLDLVELQRNIKFYDMQPLAEGPFAFLDVQKLFSYSFEDRKTRRSLEYAVDFLKIEKDIPFHRAFSDAYYTAKVLEKISENDLEYTSFDVYHVPSSRKEELFVRFSDYAKYISRSYADKSDVMSDRKVASTKCYLCRKNIKKTIRWFTPNGKHYYSVSKCEKHGYMKSKVRVRKSEQDRYYAVKTMRYISDDELNELLAIYERAKEHKKIKND